MYSQLITVIAVHRAIEAIAKSQNKSFQDIEEELNSLVKNEGNFDLIKAFNNYNVIIDLLKKTKDSDKNELSCPKEQNFINESCLNATEEERKEFFKNNYENWINAGGKNEFNTTTKNM